MLFHLFILYDIPDEVVNKLKIFADEPKLFYEFKSVGDTQKLHADLNVTSDWSDKCQLSFNLN